MTGGNGAAILLYNRAHGTVVLTRQFRFPAYVNGLAEGMLIEVCAGLLDKDDPEACIKREAEEERDLWSITRGKYLSLI
jgi:GDP-mannose pyrophosphatase NudK